MGRQVETLAGFVAGTRFEDIPERVRRHAKLVVLDTLGVMLAGSQRPEVRQLRTALLAAPGDGPPGPSTAYAMGFPTGDPRSVALVNGIAARSLELCEGHRFVMFQGGAQILPGLLAVAEGRHLPGRDLLCAFILGYDAGARLSLSMTPRDLVHQNGQATLLGASAAGARLRGLDATTTSLAMRLGATLMLTPSYTDAISGATALNVAGGMCGHAASLAPELALAGFEAQSDAVELSLGRLVAEGFRPETVLEDLGTRWEITRNWFRLRACCNPIHSALDALQEALARLRPDPASIERIDIRTYQFAAKMGERDPANYFASRYSLPHAAAGLALCGSTGFDTLNDDTVHDPAWAAMRQRVHVSEDMAMTAALPHRKPSLATVTLKDGRSASGTCDLPRGDFQNPYDESEIRAKFHGLAAHVLSADGARRAEAAVDAVEDWEDVAGFVKLLRQASR
ncbi:MAG: MmgE/PrpD family protein [bacterium]|nr:MmgE/PrpD family protein [Rhodocyclaceae bacterium]MCA4904551.1 MmgE/PrpD family protein [Rhodocyclaceae bacterium]MCE2979228.1 MmgE/PrpD family protein [Betaproteobacteria bacterium]